MDMNARTAFVNARVAMLNARIVEMQTANAERERNGHAQAYDDNAFAEVQKEFCDLEYNNVLAYLRGDLTDE
jgi:hypothetical protein